ncbi:hypothetical protein EWM64_g4029 [Hericium alpestre]|uniref:Uncharacterized protein n=1 Tax=Hericium alpestre TaxID=135208 RepID=A0A4Z0A0Y1_9AGAM|nr:hypothetical protein EWM64_g4029 [Hericium alpestre]
MDDPILVAERAVPRAGNLRMRHPHVSPLEAVRINMSTERETYWDVTDWAAERNRVFFIERVRHAIGHELHEAQKAAFVEEGRNPEEAPLPTQEHVTAEVASYLDERVTAIRDAAGAFPPSDEALRAAQRYGWRWTREDLDRILPEDDSANGVLHSDGRKKKNYSPRFVPANEGTTHLCKPF